MNFIHTFCTILNRITASLLVEIFVCFFLVKYLLIKKIVFIDTFSSSVVYINCYAFRIKEKSFMNLYSTIVNKIAKNERVQMRFLLFLF